MQLKENTLFDNRYRLIKQLGSGGFSEVWLAEDIKVYNKKMALKVYAPGYGLDDDGVKLFSKEFELVFDINHKNLLRPTHFDVYERSPYLVLPFCEKGSASKLVGNISEQEAWRFLSDVAEGLAYMHQLKEPLIHQDIKPDNVLINQNGDYLITDFGISTKARTTLHKSIGDLKSGGTLAYMPPEKFSKDNIPIKASDIWALGATLFELLEGDVPFGEHGGLVQKSGAEIPKITNEYSQNLKNIVYKMLANEPWDRPMATQLIKYANEQNNVDNENNPVYEPIIPKKNEAKAQKKSNAEKYILAAIAALIIVVISVDRCYYSTNKQTLENPESALVFLVLIIILGIAITLIYKYFSKDTSAPHCNQINSDIPTKNELKVEIPDTKEEIPDTPKLNELKYILVAIAAFIVVISAVKLYNNVNKPPTRYLPKNPTTYLSTNPTSLSFNNYGGTQTIVVTTDGNSYDIADDLPYWCRITNKTKTSFQIVCRSNYLGDAREHYFYVTSGTKDVRININQDASAATRYGSRTSSYQNTDSTTASTLPSINDLDLD